MRAELGIQVVPLSRSFLAVKICITHGNFVGKKHGGWFIIKFISPTPLILVAALLSSAQGQISLWENGKTTLITAALDTSRDELSSF